MIFDAPETEAEVFVFPASFAQQRLWLLQQLAPDNPFYNVPLAVRLTGALNLTALGQAFAAIEQRHETLRTNFHAIAGQPMQVIAAGQRSARIPVVDLRSTPAAAAQRASAEFQRPFDLAIDPLLRVKLLRLSNTEYVLLLTLHHIVADGWSMGVLLRELGAFYQALAAGESLLLPPLPIQYADYAQWQRDWLQGDVLAAQLDYWRQQLADAPITQLPTCHPRPAVASFRGARVATRLPQALRAAVVELSDRQGTTLFMTLLAAFQVLLYRYTGQPDQVVGTPIANRNRREIEGLIGFFANTLVLRTDLSGDPSFCGVLQRVREVTLGAYAHQDLPFEKLVEALQPDRSLSHNPLFQIVFALQNAAIEPLQLVGLTLEPLNLDPGTARCDLEWQMVEYGEAIAMVVTYSTDLFEQTAIERMMQRFQTVLENAVRNPQQPLSELSMLTSSERDQLLVEWNQTAAEYADSAGIHRLIEAQVERTPEAIAAVDAQQQITYRQLNNRSNQLAHYLHKQGVGAEVLVGIGLERSIEALIAVLAVLKAGGAYLPLDPSYPAERLSFMLADAQPALLIGAEPIGAEPAAPTLCLAQHQAAIARCPMTNPMGSAAPLAYVIYTSGSTGMPKGVRVPHQGLCNVAQVQAQQFDVQPQHRVLQFAALSFDASVFEIVMALTHGAALYWVPSEARSGQALHQFLQRHCITHATLPPSVLKTLPIAALPDLQVLITAGEACPPQQVANWAAGRRFFNAYGPTETTIWATVAELRPQAPIAIGRPIANTQVYVLDPQLQPVPVGVAGELYIGGVGVAQGYLNRPQLTADRFIANPFSASSKLYRTGDRVRYQPDGSLQFLGRMDDQVKLRGYRIELGEIEAALRQHEAVEEAIAQLSAAAGAPQLIAYVTLRPQRAASAPDLLGFLRQKLPAYLLPAAVEVCSALPLTATGKIDRSALGRSAQPARAPRTPTEAALAELWAQLLQRDSVSVEASFFELGGDSLLAVQAIDRIEQRWQRALPLSALFQTPSIAQLAAQLDAPFQTAASPLVPLQPEGQKQPFFCVHPILGTVFPYYQLARQLDADQPFYALQPLGLSSDQPPQRRIEEMAAAYIAAMRQVHPPPYAIGGWSFGGLVAFEMARQLDRAGERVALLAILDTVAPLARPSLAWRDGAGLALTGLRSIAPFLLDYARLSLPRQSSRIKPLSAIAQQQLRHEFSLQSLLRVYRANVEAALRYQPQPIAQPIALFRSRQFAHHPDPSLGWQQLTTAPVHTYAVSGNHLTLLQTPQVHDLARQLQDCLDRAT